MTNQRVVVKCLFFISEICLEKTTPNGAAIQATQPINHTKINLYLQHCFVAQKGHRRSIYLFLSNCRRHLARYL